MRSIQTFRSGGAVAVIVAALSLSALTGCTASDPEAQTGTPSASAATSETATARPSASRTSSSTASASPSPSATPTPAPAPPMTQAPAAPPVTEPTPAPSPPAAAAPAPIAPQPATENFVVTAEEAINIIAEYHNNTPDLQYEATDNGDGTYDVHVTSLKNIEQGGDGDAGTYVVGPDKAFVLK